MGESIRCVTCGFDQAEAGKQCPSCGSADAASLATQMAPTVYAPPENDIPAKSGSLNQYPVDSLYADRYLIRKFLGRGGMGSVYKVLDQTLQQEQALKILNNAAYGEDGGARFKREIEILSKLNHPSVPKVYGWGMNGEELYFLSEYVDGRDLKTEIRKRGPWPPAEAAEIVAKIADVLSFAHSKGIIHRDVKPNNVMLSNNDDNIFLLDFGVARATGQGMETLTQTGMVIGTPEYMAPEQFTNHRVDERGDIYSVGVLLYELLTGQTPFSGETPVAIALKQLQEAPPPPRVVRKDVPAWLNRIVLKCLEKDRKNRYVTASELAGELRKPRGTGRPTLRWLPTGDAVVEDDSETSEWALVLSSQREKQDWGEGMGLRFAEQLFKLEKVEVPQAQKGNRWSYCFSYWPQQEVFRRLVDYDKDAAERAAISQADGSRLMNKMMRFLKRDLK